MPTKRRFILFLIVLAVMLLIKRAVGQEAAVGWDPQSCWHCGVMDVDVEIMTTLMFGTFVGGLAGIWRVQCRAIAEREGRYFTGDLIELRLR